MCIYISKLSEVLRNGVCIYIYFFTVVYVYLCMYLYMVIYNDVELMMVMMITIWR